MHNAIAGALYDFLGYLTTKPDDFKVGRTSTVQPVMDAFAQWAKERGLDIEDEPMVRDWQNKLGTAEALIECVVRLGESYGTPYDLMAPGAAAPGSAGGGPGRKDDTNFSKRRKWMDSKREGAVSNDGLGSERDLPAGDIVRGRTHSEDDWLARRFEKLYARRPDLKPENFGMAGMPGGVRNDPEAPVDFLAPPRRK